MTRLLGAMLSLALALVAVDSAGSGPARACATPGMTAKSLQSRIAGVRIITMTGPRVERFLRAFNAEPPASDYTADTLLIAHAAMKPSVLLVMYENGCLKHAGAISPELYRRIWQASHDAGRHI